MQNYFTQYSFSQQISRFSASLFFAAIVGVLAGCSGGSDTATGATSAGTTPTTPTVTAPTAASIQLLASSTQIASSGLATVDLTAIVLSATKQAVSGRTVIFTTPPAPETAFTNNISASGVSDANGIVTTKLNIGANKANRTITVTATADSATATNSVDVTGTTVTISGNSSLALSAPTTLRFSVKDSAATALKNIPVSVTSASGNPIALSPATGITDSTGQITAVVTGSIAGSDTITATAAGASATQTLTISGESFAFKAPALVAPATSIDIPLNTPTAVSVNRKDTAGSAVAGSAISFSASRGTIAGSPSTTNAAGDTPGVTVSSTTAGPSIITASGPGGTPSATLDVVFVATSASNATVQAVPGTIQVTTGSASQSNNSSTISVVVRDAANNLVKNAGVTFSNPNDPSGGRLTSSSGVTDVSGSASVTYVASGTSSAQNGVTISATVNSIGGVSIAPAVVTGITTLTVAGQSLLVRLGTDNKVGGTAPTNTKTYVAIVTDAGGNPSVGTTVNFALRPSRYAKGRWVPAGTVWVQNFTTPFPYCANEDLNFNGILDPGEGLVVFPAGVTPALRPGAVASVNATAVTDASGVAIAKITYAKGYSYWAEVTLEARTAVTSNDPPTIATFFLPGPAEDYKDITIDPPGNPSPFGSGKSCFDTL